MNEKRCGCCEGLEKLIPLAIVNRPGLNAIAYRVGTHAAFLETMKARLTGIAELEKLTTREASDPAIALLDAWATVADVLTFYQERIANEGYLRTATERRSILELARLVGYRLRPGVAASVFLAFTLEKDYEIEVPAGTRAQSIPAPGELPQSFETSEPLEARTEWNELKPRSTRPQVIQQGMPLVYLQGTSTNLKPNAPLLLFDVEGGHTFRQALQVKPDAKADRTMVILGARPAMDQHTIRLARIVKAGYPPEEEGPYSKAIGERAVEEIRTAMGNLVDRLHREGQPPGEMERAIALHTPRIEQTARIFRALNLDVLAEWVDEVRLELDASRRELEEFPRETERTVAKPLVEADIGRVRSLIDSAPSRPSGRPYALEIGGAELNEIQASMRNLARTLTNDQIDDEEKALAVQTTLLQLDQLDYVFEELGFEDARDWVGTIRRSLAETTPASISDDWSTGQIDVVPVSNTLLTSLIEPLQKPPAQTPSSALKLKRNVSQIFTPTGDMAPRLLTTMMPKLRTNLYRAWSGAEVYPAGEMMGVQALRVKAAPFGHNAPLKPIYDDEGYVKDYEEWPLTEPVTTTVAFVEGDGETPIVHSISTPATGLVDLVALLQGQLVIERSETTLKQIVPLTSLGSQIVIPIDGHTVHIGPEDDSSLSFAFAAGGFLTRRRTFQLSFLGTSMTEAFLLQLKSDDQLLGAWQVEQNQKIEQNVDGGRVTIDRGLGLALSISYKAAEPLPEMERRIIALDAEYDQIVPNSWVTIQRPARDDPTMMETKTLNVNEVRSLSKAGFGISGKVTELTLNGEWLYPEDTSLSVLRRTTVYAQSEELALAEAPITKDVAGKEIELGKLHDGLTSGKWLIVSGERTDVTDTAGNVIPGIHDAELVMLANVIQGPTDPLPGEKPYSTLILTDPLVKTYKRDSVKIYGNVIKATHGETREEVLGSGDGTQTNQRFTLRQKPLTYLAAPTPAGAESTLEVRINSVRWHEKERMVALEPDDRAFITQTNDDSETTVIFGDGRHGARLPTGVENVKAKYRNGIGRPGNVPAEQISLLATKPLGVKSVINPLPASGGADREDRDQARQNVPLAMMALDRLVSVRDYADFARTYAGIGKASAVRLPGGSREIVHVTIAGADDVPITPQSDLYRNLTQALGRYGDPYQPFRVDLRELILLVVSAKVRLHPDYLWESVEPKIRQALLNTFSFSRRDLGQDALYGEAIAAIQAVRGVSYVDLDVFDGVGEERLENLLSLGGELTADNEFITALNLKLKHRIPANLAGVIPGTYNVRPAQLILLSPEVRDTLILVESDQ